jgi:ligand-binding sensor domain-containing protein
MLMRLKFTNVILFSVLILGLLSNWVIADILPKNANWEIATYTSAIRAVEVSKDGETLWVATTGGLEHRDATTGELIRVLTTLDGLPSNFIMSLASDSKGGLWIGTLREGLVHFDGENQWRVFNTDNSDLPHNIVFSLKIDDNDGVWVGVNGGIAYLNSASKWTIFNTDNSDLLDNNVEKLALDGNTLWVGSNGLSQLNSQTGKGKVFHTGNSDLPGKVATLETDDNGGVWIGTYHESETGAITGKGLAHLTTAGKWTIFTTDNSDLPHNTVISLKRDSRGGLWIGTEKGLAYLTSVGEWTTWHKHNSDLPNNFVLTLFSEKDNGLWIGTNKGISHFNHSDDEWLVPEEKKQWRLPDNIVQAFTDDDNGGLWIGTHFGGLAHKKAGGEWQVFDIDNSPLPVNDINALLNDGKGGVWVGTYGGGLHHLSSTGDWTSFTELNSKLPKNDINIILSNGNNGIWIATDEGGLAQLSDIPIEDGTLKLSNAEWRIFNKSNSELLDDDINIVISDNKGGLWLGTNDGLAHLSASSKWDVFTTTNSDLPKNQIFSLANEGSGVWVGTKDGGLARLDKKGNGKVFNVDNSDLPHDSVVDIIQDNKGGVWSGTYDGLAHLDSDDKWTVFNTDNSGLPSGAILKLMDDGNHGLWIGLSWGGGLTHLSFGNPFEGNRAAILIHPNVRESRKKHRPINKSIVGHIYHALSKRYYTNEEIYLVSYTGVDTTQDYIDDEQVVDAGNVAMTLNDIRQAFDWAKRQGNLIEPLLLVIVAEGLSEGQLVLDPETDTFLSSSDLKTLLDDYQQATGNQIAVVLETSYSGKFIPELKKDENRIIITSTSDEETTQHADTLGKDAFSWRFFRALRGGNNLWEAFYAVEKNFPQSPQFDDDDRNGRLAKEMCLNGCFAPIPGKTVYRLEDDDEESEDEADENEPLKVELDKDVLQDRRKDSYVGIGLPDGTLFIFTGQNDFFPFDGEKLSPWQGSSEDENVVVELPLTPALPKGNYGLYLLRVDKGVEPLAHPEDWELNVGSLTIE